MYVTHTSLLSFTISIRVPPVCIIVQGRCRPKVIPITSTVHLIPPDELFVRIKKRVCVCVSVCPCFVSVCIFVRLGCASVRVWRAFVLHWTLTPVKSPAVRMTMNARVANRRRTACTPMKASRSDAGRRRTASRPACHGSAVVTSQAWSRVSR